MIEWKEYKFSETLVNESISYGVVQPGSHKNDGVPIVRVNNIKKGCILIDEVMRVDHSIEQKYRKTRLEGGELLITLVGSVGECAIVPDSLKGWNVARAVSVARIKPNFDKRFIKYCFQLEEIKHQLYGNTNDTVQPTLNLSSLKDIILKCPSTSEQKAISEVLTSLDDKIDLLHKQNKTLEQLAETLFRHHFIDNAQDDWEDGKLGDFLTPRKGKNITKSQVVEGLVPVIAGGLSPSCFHNKANTSAPVITISASGANAGHVALHHKPVWSSDSSFIDKSITPYVYFFYVFLKTNQEKITDKQEGSAQPHIYPSHLMDLDILKYPDDLILESETFLEQSFIKIGANIEQIQTLEKLRDQLLPKLMSGEIRLNQQTNNQ